MKYYIQTLFCLINIFNNINKKKINKNANGNKNLNIFRVNSKISNLF